MPVRLGPRMLRCAPRATLLGSFGEGAKTSTRGHPFDCRSGQAVRSPKNCAREAEKILIM
jgi:hypothetical protein